jgi:hypothetical protein
MPTARAVLYIVGLAVGLALIAAGLAGALGVNLFAFIVLVIAGLTVIAIWLARAVPWPGALGIRPCLLAGWVGVAVIAISAFLPWMRVTETDGQPWSVRDGGSLVEAWPLALLFAAPLVVAVDWLLRPERNRVRRGLVGAAAGAGFVLVAEFVIVMFDSTWRDELRHDAEIGVHLALAGYVVLTLATAAAERITVRDRAHT